jgi:hypothetical protein
MDTNERVKYFNQQFITVIKKNCTSTKTTQDIQVEVYANALLAPISMFIKCVRKHSLSTNPYEAKKV